MTFKNGGETWEPTHVEPDNPCPHKKLKDHWPRMLKIRAANSACPWCDCPSHINAEGKHMA